MGYFIGCDLGGTNLRAAIVNSTTGEVSNLTIIPTLAREGHEEVLLRMADLFTDLFKKSGLKPGEIKGIGIGVPGMMDVDRGLTTFITNLPGHWINVPVASFITERTGIPTFLINDVRAITWGELKFGAGKGCQSMVCYAIGTGIGGGVVINNQLVLGNTGQAGELGHMTVNPNGPLCNCGNHGCLEQYSSGPAIKSAALKAISHGGTTILGEMIDYDLNKMTPEVVFNAALRGDEIARNIFENAGYYLGVAIGNSIVTLEPQRIVIGGGIAQAGELLFNPIRKAIQERVFLVPTELIQIVPAELGNNAGVIGASMWAEYKINK
ncbi:MAG: ROK family protein [Flexilinea sp.]|jgi:glucokinase